MFGEDAGFQHRLIQEMFPVFGVPLGLEGGVGLENAYLEGGFTVGRGSQHQESSTVNDCDDGKCSTEQLKPLRRIGDRFAEESVYQYD